jgi:hypothetical protein
LRSVKVVRVEPDDLALLTKPRAVMLDLVYLAAGLAAFALFGAYAALLRRL